MTVQRIRTRVIAVLEQRFVRVLIGPGIGLLDGGIQSDIPIEIVPVDLRTPNSEFYLVGNPGVNDPIIVERIDSPDS